MSVSVSSRPNTWSAVKNPLVYKLRRTDHFMDFSGPDAIADSGGFAQITLDSSMGDVTSYYTAGNTIYFECDNLSYAVQSEVTSSSFSAGTTKILTTTPFSTTGDNGGIVNNLSKRTDYRIEVEVFKASDDESLTDGVVFSFTPDNTGIAYCDVSTIIKAYLTADWIEPSALNEVESDTFRKFYIKYQEYYDGALVGSQTDDVVNPRYAVYAGLQIPSTNGNNLTDYVPASSSKQFLTLFDTPKLWRDYPATLSFIHTYASALWVFRSQYNAALAALQRNMAELTTANDDSVNRLDINSGITIDDAAESLGVKLGTVSVGSEIFSNNSFVATLTPWTHVAGAGGDWAWAAGDRAEATFIIGGTTTDVLRQDFSAQVAGWYRLQVNVGSADILQTMIGTVYSGSTSVQQILSQEFPISTSGLTTWTYYVYIESAFDRIEFYVTRTNTAAPKQFSITAASLKLLTITDQTETLTFGVEDACDNPVLLFWKNSLGGDSWWLFESGQEAGYNFSGTKKAKRMTLFADHLTLDQWEALNELNTLGEVYQENIVELTSSVNKTAVRDGAQVYVVDEDGNKTGVIVVPSTSVINTRDVTHSIEIEIEFPERVE